MDKTKSTKTSPKLTEQLKRLTLPVTKHHVVIVAVLCLGLLIYSVFVVSRILLDDDGEFNKEAMGQTITTRFDQSTIEQIKQLKSRQQSANLGLPSGRINPFD